MEKQNWEFSLTKGVEFLYDVEKENVPEKKKIWKFYPRYEKYFNYASKRMFAVT